MILTSGGPRFKAKRGEAMDRVAFALAAMRVHVYDAPAILVAEQCNGLSRLADIGFELMFLEIFYPSHSIYLTSWT